MNWLKRKRVCENQVYANNVFGNAPIGGVKVKDENGNEIYLNQHPKTDWDKELEIANRKLDAQTTNKNL